jgi:hypothetical protein
MHALTLPSSLRHARRRIQKVHVPVGKFADERRDRPGIATDLGFAMPMKAAERASEATGMPDGVLRWIPLIVPGAAVVMGSCIAAVVFAVL